MTSGAIILFQILILVFSVIVHEISHGFIALRFGDSTAKDLGRLTLNPLKHLDLFGSLLLPLMLALLHAPVIGWAKPVPYDPRNLKNPKKESGLIALAGPLSNLLVAAVFGIIVRSMVLFGPLSATSQIMLVLFNVVILLNIALALFNLIPIPPLDGSGILFSLLPQSFRGVELFMRQYGFFILLFIIFYGLPGLEPLLFKLHALFAGSGSALGL